MELLSGGDPDSTEYSLLTTLIDEKYECVDQNITLFDTYNYTVYVPTNEAIEKLHVAEINILVMLVDRLGAEEKRLDYKELAEDLGLSRNTVKYNVEKLIDAGLIAKRGGKLSVKEDIYSEATGSG